VKKYGGMQRKKKKLSERSEFFFFSGMEPDFSKKNAALTFCFFSVKGKEKRKTYKTPPNSTTPQ